MVTGVIVTVCAVATKKYPDRIPSHPGGLAHQYLLYHAHRRLAAAPAGRFFFFGQVCYNGRIAMLKTTHVYNRIAERWMATKNNSFFHQPQFERWLRFFHPRDKILDIGCAGGVHVPLFLGLGRKLRYEGIDSSRAMLAIARRRYPQLTFHLGDISQGTVLPRQHYAGFWAAAVLMHIPPSQWPQLFTNLKRLVRPGGVGYITLPDRFPVVDEAGRYFSRWTRKQVRAMLKAERCQLLADGDLGSRAPGHHWRWYLIRLPR